MSLQGRRDTDLAVLILQWESGRMGRARVVVHLSQLCCKKFRDLFNLGACAVLLCVAPRLKQSKLSLASGFKPFFHSK